MIGLNSGLFERFKIWVRGTPTLYCLASSIYALTVGVAAAFKFGLLKAILLTYGRSRTKRLVIVYCFFPSHFQNIRGIPELLAKTIPFCEVWVLCNFGRDEYPVSVDHQNVLVQQGIPYHICRLIHADLFLSAMVGLSPCSMPFGAQKIHFLVSLAGLDGVYLDHHFDGWDYIFCAGEAQIADFRRLAGRRDISGTTLIRGGYPKLDDQIVSARRLCDSIVPGSVIYAPTHVYQGNQELATFLSHGESIVNQLLQLGIATTFRPHPASFGHPEDAMVIAKICEKHKHNDLFRFDDSKEYSNSYASAAIMLTDLSGTGFTFAFAFERPTIFFAPHEYAEKDLQGAHFNDRERIGLVVRNLDQLVDAVHEVEMSYQSFVKNIRAYRDGSVFNVGMSREFFVKSAVDILEQRDNFDWEIL